MELLDRYLNAAKPFLPEEQRADILKELSENIREQMDDRASELGRPLQEAEQEALLRQFGHPVIVAGRYRQDQRSVTFGRRLIGPELFPFYWKVLQINVGITAIILLLITIARFAMDTSFTVSEGFSTALFALSIQFGIITLIFTAAESSLTKFPDLLRSEKAFPFRFFDEASDQRPPSGSRVSRLESFSQLVALAVFTPWFLSVLRSPETLFGSAAAHFQLTPVWDQVYYPLLLLALFSMAQAGINLLRPEWVKFRSVANLVMDTGAIALIGFLAMAGKWIVLTGSSEPLNDGVYRLLIWANQSIFYTLLVAGLIFLAITIGEVRRLIGLRQSHLQKRG